MCNMTSTASDVVDPATATNIKTNTNHRVGFACVQVREYFRILGDNPSVSAGPPITLSWSYDETPSDQCTIDEWELQRCNERRTRVEFRVPEDIRTDWVLDAGYSEAQVQEVVDAIDISKKEWRSSIEKSSLHDKVDGVTEGMKRRWARAVGKREKSNILYTKWKCSSEEKRRVSATTPSSSKLVKDDASYRRYRRGTV
mmetsp:Transcript_35007/g.73847  ORF Transcript_35007/g.73847 Transcript_35007/m.73847 type:complete len:199 (-) Transcript_35007:227-823(-)